jgi:tetratricopeptide (TPR) repeat protein
MRKLSIIAFALLVSFSAIGQKLTEPPSGDNQKSVVIQYMGPVSVTISYSSPDVHGPQGEDRTGKIWGEVVHYGFIDQGFGPSKSAPWRAGANENTTIAFSHDVKINGKDLKAGTYGLFLDVEKEGAWNWIFSNNSKSWGSYFYNPKEDALRVATTAEDAPYVEYLTFNFDERKPSSTVAYLQWEKKRVPMKIEVPNIDEVYVNLMRDELRGDVGFDYKNLVAAADFCAQRKIHLDEALAWADSAIYQPYFGRQEFNTFRTKATVLSAMGKEKEADAVMLTAVNHPTATVPAVHQYGKSLLTEGKNEKALDIFKLNRKNHPEDTFTTYVGLARGFTAVGDKKSAIKNWELAIKNLPADQKRNQKFYEDELKKLKG